MSFQPPVGSVNPVLDAFVQIVVSTSDANVACNVERLTAIYDTVRDLALKEPGGLQNYCNGGIRLVESEESASQD